MENGLIFGACMVDIVYSRIHAVRLGMKEKADERGLALLRMITRCVQLPTKPPGLNYKS